jgi:hypothetical protein
MQHPILKRADAMISKARSYKITKWVHFKFKVLHFKMEYGTSKCNLQDFYSNLYLVRLLWARKKESNCHWGRIQMQSMQLGMALTQ